MLQSSCESVSIFANYVLSSVIKVSDNDTLHAYKPLLPAVKTGQPHDLRLQRYKNYWNIRRNLLNS